MRELIQWTFNPCLDGETIAEPGDETVQRVTEFFTTFINTTYLIQDRGVLHTDRCVLSQDEMGPSYRQVRSFSR